MENIPFKLLDKPDFSRLQKLVETYVWCEIYSPDDQNKDNVN